MYWLLSTQQSANLQNCSQRTQSWFSSMKWWEKSASHALGLNALESWKNNITSKPSVKDVMYSFSKEFFDSLKLSELPAHNLELTIGCPIILRKNLNLPRLWNIDDHEITPQKPHCIKDKHLKMIFMMMMMSWFQELHSKRSSSMMQCSSYT